MKNSSDTDACSFVTIHDHKEYLDILNKIRPETEKIVTVQISGVDEDDPVVETAKQMMTLESFEKVSAWYGTRTRGCGGAIAVTSCFH